MQGSIPCNPSKEIIMAFITINIIWELESETIENEYYLDHPLIDYCTITNNKFKTKICTYTFTEDGNLRLNNLYKDFQ